MSKEGKTEMEKSEAEQLLKEEDTGCLCLSNEDGEPYGVPVSYAFIDGRIIFHCSLKGKKLDFVRENQRVSFVVSRHPGRVRPHHPEKGCDYRYESVICSGKAEIIKDMKKRHELLNKFLAHFNVRLGKKPDENLIPKEVASNVGCVVIEIQNIAGRKKIKTKD